MVRETINGTFRQTNLPNESEEYLSKREELRRAEIELMNQRERVAELRRRLPKGPAVEDYVFEEVPVQLDEGDKPVRTVRLSQLFTGPDRSVVIYQFIVRQKTNEAMPDVHGVDRQLHWYCASPGSKSRSGDRCCGGSGSLAEPCSGARLEQIATPECRFQHI